MLFYQLVLFQIFLLASIYILFFFKHMHTYLKKVMIVINSYQQYIYFAVDANHLFFIKLYDLKHFFQPIYNFFYLP